LKDIIGVRNNGCAPKAISITAQALPVRPTPSETWPIAVPCGCLQDRTRRSRPGIFDHAATTQFDASSSFGFHFFPGGFTSPQQKEGQMNPEKKHHQIPAFRAGKAT
jgi:hypothetical protein